MSTDHNGYGDQVVPDYDIIDPDTINGYEPFYYEADDMNNIPLGRHIVMLLQLEENK